MNAWQTNPKGRLRGGYAACHLFSRARVSFALLSLRKNGGPTRSLKDWMRANHPFLFIERERKTYGYEAEKSLWNFFTLPDTSIKVQLSTSLLQLNWSVINSFYYFQFLLVFLFNYPRYVQNRKSATVVSKTDTKPILQNSDHIYDHLKPVSKYSQDKITWLQLKISPYFSHIRPYSVKTFNKLIPKEHLSNFLVHFRRNVWSAMRINLLQPRSWQITSTIKFNKIFFQRLVNNLQGGNNMCDLNVPK